MVKRIAFLLVVVVLLAAVLVVANSFLPKPAVPSLPVLPISAGTVPDISHVVIIVLENTESNKVVDSEVMPYFNQLSAQFTLLNQYYAISHPSLPNYLALVGGDTFGINSDCTDCSVKGVSIADAIEKSNRSWKAYLENMPSACFTGASSQNLYAKRHNPFLYFDNIRTNAQRCQQSIVPLDQLDADLNGNQLPDYALISPNLCNDGHNCPLSTADQWLSIWVPKIMNYPGMKENGLLVITFDEGSSNGGCCGTGSGGGKVATLLVSSLVKNDFIDNTPYNHYSLLKTISEAWGLPAIGHSADLLVPVIINPWKQ